MKLPFLVNCVGPFAPDVGASFGTFTTKKDVSPLPIPRILPGMLEVGSIIKIEAEGEFSTTGTPTFNAGLYLGTHDGTTGTAPTIVTDIALSNTITSGSGAAAWPFRMEWRGKVTKIGSSGSITGNGNLEYGTSLTATTTVPIPITQALRTFAINTTIENAVGVSWTWGTSSASNTVKSYDISVIILN